jgi:hypothetical protein
MRRQQLNSTCTPPPTLALEVGVHDDVPYRGVEGVVRRRARQPDQPPLAEREVALHRTTGSGSSSGYGSGSGSGSGSSNSPVTRATPTATTPTTSLVGGDELEIEAGDAEGILQRRAHLDDGALGPPHVVAVQVGI